jgi:hypothetical protein
LLLYDNICDIAKVFPGETGTAMRCRFHSPAVNSGCWPHQGFFACGSMERLSFSFVLAAKPPKRTKYIVSSALPEAKKGGRGRHRAGGVK